MKKIVFVMLMSMFTTLYAGSGYKVLIGAEAAQSKADYAGSDWENNFGLRLGLEEDNSRIFISYNLIDYDSNISAQTHALNLNLEAKTNQYYGFLRGFVGGHIGAVYSTVDNANNDDDLNLIFGAQAGAIIDITKFISLDIAYKYSWTDADEASINPERMQTIYGAINLKF